MSEDSLFASIFGEMFTKEEWDLWVKGEFNLFDNYAKRTGMTNEEIKRWRKKLGKKAEKPKSLYQEYIENPIDLSKI